MTREEFYEKFKNMKPMKYYEASLDSPKAKIMLDNKDDTYIAMEKRDGEWSRMIITEDGVIFQSRSVSKVTGTYGDKTAHVPHLVKEALSFLPPGTVLLGELAFMDRKTTSKDVGSILRCLPAKAIDRQKDEKLYFFGFDLLAYGYKDLTDRPFEDRFVDLIDTIYDSELNHSDKHYICTVNSMRTKDEVFSFMDYADKIWSEGGEGLVIIPKDEKYEPGKRTAWRSLKVKKKMGTLELKVVGLIEPNKEYTGIELENWNFWVDENDKRITRSDILNMRYVGKIEPVTKPYFYGWKNGVIVEHNGNLVRVTSGLTDKDRKFLSTELAATMLEKGELTALITGMEATPDSIRHPVFIKLKQ